MSAAGLLAVSADPKAEAAVSVLWTILILMGVVLGAALLIVAIGRWLKRTESALPSSGAELASFRVLYERGEFSQEEYEQIRSRLKQQLRKQLNVNEGQPKEAPPEATAASGALPGNGSESTSAHAQESGEDNPDTSRKPV